MARFSYIAKAPNGERMTGTVDAPDRRNAMLQVERKGLVPVTVLEAAGSGPAQDPKAAPPKGKAPAAPAKPAKPVAPRAPRAPGAKAAFALPGRGGIRMKPKDVLLFTRELTDLITSGMTLGNALNTLSRRKLKGGKEQIIAKLRDDIIKGDSLSDALAKHPQSFPALYISMIKAGEASGKLADAMERLSKHFERMIEAREKVMMALIYPGIVMGVSSLTMIFTMTVVVPKFSKMFQELGSTMPAPTRFLMWLSSALIHWGWLMLLLIIGGVMLLKRYIATPEGRLWWDRLMLRIPVVKNVISANCFAQFSSTLAALLQNGVPVLQALTIVENTLGNVVIAREVREARERVTDGSTISVPLAQGKVFPSMLTDMLAVGEETGDMAGSLVHIARRYSAELDRQVKVFTTVLEPLMIVLMAGMVGFIAVSMLMAVFDLTSGLNVK